VFFKIFPKKCEKTDLKNLRSASPLWMWGVKEKDMGFLIAISEILQRYIGKADVIFASQVIFHIL